MVNQHKGVQQDTAYSAVVMNDHMYPRPYIVFDQKGSYQNDIGMDVDAEHPLLYRAMWQHSCIKIMKLTVIVLNEDCSMVIHRPDISDDTRPINTQCQA